MFLMFLSFIIILHMFQYSIFMCVSRHFNYFLCISFVAGCYTYKIRSVIYSDAAADGVYNSTHVITGDDTRLSCSASIENSAGWQHIPRGNKHRIPVAHGKKVFAEYGNKTRFSLDIDAASRQYDLLIRHVDLSDAGMYYCKHGTSETSVDLSVQSKLSLC